jgi:predicted dienelactone hydrolase
MPSFFLRKMGRTLRLCACAQAAGWALVAGCRPEVRQMGPHPVGVSRFHVDDPRTQRPMPVEIWYPAQAGTTEANLLYGDVYPGRAARDAPVAALPPSPLVVIGHGLKSSRFDMAWLAEALASDGLVVAAVDHPGTSADTWDAVEAVKMWHRAAQLSAVIDGTLVHADFAEHIDTERIAAVGHSAGGSAVLLLAGAQIDPQRFAKRYPASAPCPPNAGHDARVKAVIALAPGTGRVFAPEGVAQMQRPALLVSGTRDTETPDPFNAAYYHAHLPHSIWHSVPDAGHYTFKPVCNWYGKLRSRGLCLDRWNVDRQRVHNDVIAWSRAFLQAQLPPHAR